MRLFYVFQSLTAYAIIHLLWHFSELSPHSAEILFEVYDRNPTGIDAPAKFLGLGLVGIDELAVGPASSQILALQPRPYETDDVQGAITVEFVFIEGAEVPLGRRPYKMKEALKISNSQTNGEFLSNHFNSISYIENQIFVLSLWHGNNSRCC